MESAGKGTAIYSNKLKRDCIGGHGTLQKYRGTWYFAKISTAVPVLSNQKYRGSTAVLF